MSFVVVTTSTLRAIAVAPRDVLLALDVVVVVPHDRHPALAQRARERLGVGVGVAHHEDDVEFLDDHVELVVARRQVGVVGIEPDDVTAAGEFVERMYRAVVRARVLSPDERGDVERRHGDPPLDGADRPAGASPLDRLVECGLPLADVAGEQLLLRPSAARA